MQLICEAYQLMRELSGMSADGQCTRIRQVNEGELESYLIEITRDIVSYKDTDGEPSSTRSGRPRPG
jgi:6-phosphogluconate dehydrogenase